MEQRIIRNKAQRTNIVYDCVECGGGLTEVIDSRPGPKKLGVIKRRRRKCTECGARFSTWEIPVGKHDVALNKLRQIEARVKKFLGELTIAQKDIEKIDEFFEENEADS